MTIREAVQDGILVDVTETAKQAGILYPTFMTSFMVAKYDAQGPHGLLANLVAFADILSSMVGYDHYGPGDFGDHVCLLEPHEEYGHVVVILETGKLEELNLKRTTGERREYLM